MTERERQILRWIEENPLISQQEIARRAGISRSSAGVHISNLVRKGHIAGRGYILRTAPCVVVVGGVNMDIGGRSFGPLVEKDSNPGRVRMSLGGVGRNIAHNLSLLGVETHLLTAMGDDVSAQEVAAVCGAAGIDISRAIRVPYAATPTYLFISGPEGDMELALNDMEICDRITPAYLSAQLPLLREARLVVLDTNIPAESVAWLAENCPAPLMADPVSTSKAGKLRPILGKLHTLKPNQLEAELLSGVAITDADSLRRCADALLETGLQRVFISLGGEGVYAAAPGEAVHLPCGEIRRVNTTGCGDSFMAAVVWSSLEGAGLEETARAGLAAAAITMECEETINPALNVQSLRARMEGMGNIALHKICE